MTMAKTEAGVRVLKDRRSGLSPRQRAALILIGGRRSVDEVLAASAGWEHYVRACAIATELAGQLAGKDVQLALALEAAGSIAEIDALAPRLREAVGDVKFARLEAALRMR